MGFGWYVGAAIACFIGYWLGYGAGHVTRDRRDMRDFLILLEFRAYTSGSWLSLSQLRDQLLPRPSIVQLRKDLDRLVEHDCLRVMSGEFSSGRTIRKYQLAPLGYDYLDVLDRLQWKSRVPNSLPAKQR